MNTSALSFLVYMMVAFTLMWCATSGHKLPEKYQPTVKTINMVCGTSVASVIILCCAAAVTDQFATELNGGRALSWLFRVPLLIVSMAFGFFVSRVINRQFTEAGKA